MTDDIELFYLSDQLIPQDVMYDIFPSLGKLPISGGWGYTKEDAVIINKPNDGMPFNGISLEYTFSKYRTYLELITARDEDDRFSGIEFETLNQTLYKGENGKPYDMLLVKISALRDKDFEMLKEVWEQNYENDDFDKEAHMKRDKELRIEFKREFWFEISSFYGQ
jgi:hypothetical protein